MRKILFITSRRSFARSLSVTAALTLAAPVLANTEVAPMSYNELVLKYEGGGQGYGATTTLGSATGAYQFTYDTLKGLGYIASGPDDVPSGSGEWARVVWTGKDGVNSRSDFLASPEAQDNALITLSEANWQSIQSSVPLGTDVNGVPMTQSGAMFASHMMGAPRFNAWAACGFQPECLSADQAAANNMTVEEYQAHLMERMGEAAGVAPGSIDPVTGAPTMDLPDIALMPWIATAHRPLVTPGQLGG